MHGVVMGNDTTQRSRSKRFSRKVSGRVDRRLVTPERSPASASYFPRPDSDIAPPYKSLQEQQREEARRRAHADSKIPPWQRFLAYWAATQAARQSAKKATAYSASIAGPVLAGVGLVSALSILLTASSPDAVMMLVSNVPVSAGLIAGLTVAAAAALFAIVCLATYAVEHRRYCVRPARDRALAMVSFTGSSAKKMRAVSVRMNDFGQPGELTVAPFELHFD